jgi:hypothetical protein
LGVGFTDGPAASLSVLSAVVSVGWEGGLKTISASSNAAVRGAVRRQSETTGLLQEHADLATAMPATNQGRPVFCQPILQQLVARASKFLNTILKNFHTGRAVAN